ncbi:MAG: hypothetical protein Q7T71_03250 [Herbiconiux sp.]|nr:hypothetical protein [Herbiconiux sp.]
MDALDEDAFDDALSYVADPGAVTADQMVALVDAPLPTALVTSGAVQDGAESALIHFAIGADAVSVGFVKTDGGWQLEAPALLAPLPAAAANQSSWDEALRPIEQLGEVEVRTASGAVVPDAGLYIEHPNRFDDPTPVEIALTGQFGVPDQKIDATLKWAETDSPVLVVPDSGLELGGLVDRASAMLGEQMVYKSNYLAVDEPRYRIQQQAIVGLDGCTPAPTGYRQVEDTAVFELHCQMVLSPTTTEGLPVYVNDGDQFIYSGNGKECVGTLPVVGDPTWGSAPVVFSLDDGELTALWSTPETFSMSEIPARADAETLDASMRGCGDYAGVEVGDVFAGLVPTAGEESTQVVSADLT